MQPSVRADNRRREGEGGEGGAEGRGGKEMCPCGHPYPRRHGRPRRRTCVCADVPCFIPDNFKKDARVRPSH
jgi:hypothetical protein